MPVPEIWKQAPYEYLFQTKPYAVEKSPNAQLISADSALANERYQYDDAGNLIGGAHVFDEANRLLEDNTYRYQYDQQGNLTTKVTKVSGEKTTYQWDDWDQLVTIERFKTSNAPSPNLTKSFTYGPLDRRWSTTENGVKTDYVYDQSDRIAALDQSGNVNQRVTFGPAVDEPFAITGQSSTNYLHANHIGSVVGASSSGGTLGEYRYSRLVRGCRHRNQPSTTRSSTPGGNTRAMGFTTTGHAITTRSQAGSSVKTHWALSRATPTSTRTRRIIRYTAQTPADVL